jgi:CheY-like chemotaxis protein
MALVLVIDDEAPMRLMMHRLLERAGHQVLEAEDGLVGLQLLDRHKPDLVIADLFMPRKDGIETILAIRSRAPHLPVLAISGGGSRNIDMLDLTVPLGATEALAKPFRTAEFLAVLDRLLDPDNSSPTG